MRDERGQSLVLVVLAMFAIIAIAAFSIDIASWYQKRHTAQVAADSAALAAANCLASESATNTATNMCTTVNDQTRASSVATTAATANSASIKSITYGTTTIGSTTLVSNVTVTATTPAPTFFANIAGLSPTAGAVAIASVTQNSTDCTTSGSGCLMFYAASSSCNPSGLQIQVGNSVNLQGGILTNSGISFGGNGGNYYGPITYGAGCSTSNTNNVNFYDGSPTAQTVDHGTTSSPNWPIDYSQDFPKCSGTACTGPLGTPPYCTYANLSNSTWTANLGNGVYCDVGSGSGVVTGDPSTWAGSVTAGTNNSKVTMIGGTVSVSGYTVSAYSNNLIAYATSTSSKAFDAETGTTYWTGDVFAPNGGAYIKGGNIGFTGFVEAQTITDQGGDQTGAGPTYQGGSGTFTGVDSLSG